VNPPKLLVDENLSPTIALALRLEGSDVVHVRDRPLNSASDVDVFARAFSEDRIVVTFNVGDFEKLARECQLHCGLILLPTGSVPRAQQLALVRAAWALVLAEHQAGRDMVNRVLYLDHLGSFRFEHLP
jgi:predicted nuclease of predicted toxin-antitoxin system